MNRRGFLGLLGLAPLAAAPAASAISATPATSYAPGRLVEAVVKRRPNVFDEGDAHYAVVCGFPDELDRDIHRMVLDRIDGLVIDPARLRRLSDQLAERDAKRMGFGSCHRLDVTALGDEGAGLHDVHGGSSFGCGSDSHLNPMTPEGLTAMVPRPEPVS